MILGTAPYMAPEQARGKPVDKRADIWAFGVVLYEILTGKRVFTGETVTDILAGVLTSEPDLTAVPAQFQRLLKRCLEKDPQKRLRDIGDYEELLCGAGMAEVYVQTMPGVEPAGKWQVSSEGGQLPNWRHDGKELYYIAPDYTLMAVDVETEPVFRLGKPHALFKAPATVPGTVAQSLYDVSADGTKFLLITPEATPADNSPIHAIVNWQQLLKAK